MTVREPTHHLARKIAQLEKDVRALASQPQLGNSSLEGTINGYDPNGTPTIIIGAQPDGSNGAFPVTGPKPPRPSKPFVLPKIGGLMVRWDGEFADAQNAPMDFSRIEIHVGPVDFHILDARTLYDTFESPRGGEKLISLVTNDEVDVRFMARSLPGVAGEESEASRGTPILLDASSFNGTTVSFNDLPPTIPPPRIGDLWLRAPDNIAYRWDGSEWIEHRDQGIVDALIEAQAAAIAAEEKVRLSVQPEPPVDRVSPKDDGDLWMDSDNGNALHTWLAGQWIPRKLGNGSIQPGSLVARDVIATGTVTAGLLESELVLTTQLVAGSLSSDHVRIGPYGFRLIDGFGQVKVSLGGNSSFFTGMLGTGVTGTRMELVPGFGNGEFKMTLVQPGGQQLQPGSIRMLTFGDYGQPVYASGGGNAYNRPGLEIRPPSMRGSLRVPTLVMGSASEIPGQTENHSTIFFNADRVITTSVEGLELRNPFVNVNGQAGPRLVTGGFGTFGQRYGQQVTLEGGVLFATSFGSYAGAPFGLLLQAGQAGGFTETGPGSGVSVLAGQEWQSRNLNGEYQGFSASYFRIGSGRMLKEDVEEAGISGALAKLCALEPKLYHYVEADPELEPGRQRDLQRKRLGLIAEDMPAELALNGGAEGYFVDEAVIFVIAAMKELSAKVDSLSNNPNGSAK